MAFVHSLVKRKVDEKTGWYAPAELDESTDHYLSFVIPVAEGNRIFDEYTCEAVRIGKADKRTVVPCVLTKQGKDAFLLNVNQTQLWFVVRSGRKQVPALPYIGTLKHPDFEFALTEIEPEDPSKLDKLCEDEDTFLIGCDPFLHYSGPIKRTKAREEQTV